MQVARRVKAVIGEVQGPEARARRKAVRYECACAEGWVYLHPDSALHSAAPEFVVYSQLVQSSKRPYMTGVLPHETGCCRQRFRSKHQQVLACALHIQRSN